MLAVQKANHISSPYHTEADRFPGAGTAISRSGNRSYTTAPLKQYRSGYRCIVSGNCSKCSGNCSMDSGHPCAFPLQEMRPAPGEAVRSRRSSLLQEKRPERSGLLHKKRLTAAEQLI